jgi:hypothetical protein
MKIKIYSALGFKANEGANFWKKKKKKKRKRAMVSKLDKGK